MAKLKIGLTGIGGYAAYYMEFLLHNPFNKDFEFVAVVDPFAKNSKYYQELVDRQIPIYDAQKEFYENHQVDLMMISTPIQFHREHTEYAIQHGSHVLCEKPTAALLSDVESMVKVSDEYGKEVFIGFQLPFADPILKLKNDLLNNAYGEVIGAKSLTLTQRDDVYYNRGSGWAGKIYDNEHRAIYDSVASNATAHYLHILFFLFGETIDTSSEIDSVDGKFCKANPIETFDTSIIRVKTKKDKDILFIASHATKGNIGPKFEIHCEQATIYFDAKSGGMLKAKKNTGDIIEYGLPMEKEQDYQKVIKILDWLDDKTLPKPPCTATTTLPFISVINEIFNNFKFEKFDDSVIKYDDEKKRFFVENLYNDLTALYDNS